MKIRNGFVTNSSSSSFVIALKTRDNPSLEAFKNALLPVSNCDTMEGSAISSIEEFDKYFLKENSYRDINTIEKILEDDEYLAKEYAKQRALIEEGFSIIFKSIGYSDEGLAEFIDKFAEMFKEDCILLQNE